MGQYRITQSVDPTVSPNGAMDYFSYLLKNDLQSDKQWTWSSYRQMQQVWRANSVVIRAAGGLVRCADEKLLVIYRNNLWDMPKGKVEGEERYFDAATREVYEETGVRAEIVHKPPHITHHIYVHQDSAKFYLKKTYWYLMHCIDSVGKPIPQREEGIQKVVWVDEATWQDMRYYAYRMIQDLVKELIW